MIRSSKLLLLAGTVAVLTWGLYPWGENSDSHQPVKGTGKAARTSATARDASGADHGAKLTASERESFGVALAEARHAVLTLDGQAATLPQNAGTRFFAYNPAQGLTARFGESSLRIGDRFNEVTLARTGSDTITTVVSSEGSRVEYRHADGVVEWWENQTAGFQQGFVVPEGVARDSSVRINVATDGMSVDADPTSPGNLRFCEANGEPRFGYRDLKAWDAHGTELAATMSPADGGLEISVATAGAVFPIVIDPIVVKLQGILRPQALGPVGPQDAYGDGLAVAGDLAAVGAPYDEDDFGYRGAVYVFRKKGGVWQFEARLRAPLEKDVAFFPMGFHVAIADGQIYAASPGRTGQPTRPGYVQVFTQARGKWKAGQKIYSPDRDNNNFEFATDFAVSGDTLGVSAWGNDGTGRLYYFTRKRAKWVHSQTLDTPQGVGRFGMEGDTSAAGSNGGWVSIYRRNGTTWAHDFTVSSIPGNMISDIEVSGGRVAFGAFLAVNGGGVRTGAVFIYENSGGTWSPRRIDAPNPTMLQNFATEIAFAGNWLFTTNGGNGAAIHTYLLDPEPVAGPVILKPENYYGIGSSIAVSGTRLLVSGTIGHSSGHMGSGVESFDLAGDTWQSGGRLNPGYNGAEALATSGNTSGANLAITGEKAFFGAPGDANPESYYSGCVYVFRRVKKGWRPEARLTAPVPRMDSGFGRALAAIPGRLVVGSRELAANGQDSVCGHVFTNAGMTWTHEEALALPTTGLPQLSDMTLTAQGNRILIGLPWQSMSGQFGNAVLFTKESDHWVLEKTFPGDGVRTATSVALGPDAVWIAAWNNMVPAVYGHAKENGVWTLKTTLNALVDDGFNSVVAPVLALSGDHLWVATQYTNGGVVAAYPTDGTTAGAPFRFRNAIELPFSADYRIAASGDVAAVLSSSGEDQYLPRIQFLQHASNRWELSDHIDLTGSVAGMALHGDTLLTLDPEGVNEAFPDEKVMQGFVRYFRLPFPQPDIAVSQGKNIVRGGKLTLKPGTLTLTIHNKGEATLADIDARIEGEDAGNFVVGSLLARKLRPGESMDLEIQFAPVTSGPKAAKLVVTSNDSDENPHTIQLLYSPRR